MKKSLNWIEPASAYRYTGKAEAALKILFGIYDSVNLLDNTESAINARRVIYDSFTLPFTKTLIKKERNMKHY